MKNLAIITARGGSRRIPRKNIKEFCGKPIIAYTIDAVMRAGIFDEIMVSTDDAEIAFISRTYGARIPFMRSEETSGDFATTDAVIDEVIRCYAKQAMYFDRFCCLYPTAPFLTAERIKEAMSLLDVHESVMPVVAFDYPPQRSVVIRDGRLVRAYPEYLTARSQDLEKLYHDCGQFYACRTESFLRDKTTDVEDLVPLILSRGEVQDIDTMEDWNAAEAKYLLLHPEIRGLYEE